MEQEIRKSVKIVISLKASKFFEKHKDIRKKFIDIIYAYYDGIKEFDIKELSGYKNIYRARIGKYRVIYTVVNREIVIVDVLLAGSRGDVYKKIKILNDYERK